jgi:hypothetical protein
MVRMWDFDFVIGIDNVADKTPPFFPGRGNTVLNTFDGVGRYFHAAVGYKFM